MRFTSQNKKELKNYDLFKPFLISDYYFSKSLIFAKNTLQGDEFNLYRKIYNIIYTSLPKPNIYVYLFLKIDNLKQNITNRGREYEKNIEKSYLQKIQKGYFEYFKQKKDFTFLIIDTNGIDFVNNNDDFEKIVEIIFDNKYKKGINRIIL